MEGLTAPALLHLEILHLRLVVDTYLALSFLLMQQTTAPLSAYDEDEFRVED